jgi:hypothetical protein
MFAYYKVAHTCEFLSDNIVQLKDGSQYSNEFKKNNFHSLLEEASK